MPVTFDLPADLETHLRQQYPDLDRDAKEAFTVEAYRAGRLSIGQVSDVLGISVYEAEGFLKNRGAVREVCGAEIQEDLASLRDLLSR
ncbi:MAG: UPF0175 family protein [Planctomycetes bacterium]|nr:UPF0175 family protein [Planctomycetota bacterium]